MAELSLVARILLAVVFGTAAVGKARHIRSFTGTLLDVGIPRWAAKVFAPLIIGYEGFLAILLASGGRRYLAVLLVIGLLFAFTTISLAARLSNRIVLCNCFGVGGSRLGLSTIARSALLAIPAAAYAFVPTNKTRGIGPLWTPVLVGSLTAGSLLVGLWVLAAPKLASLIAIRREPWGSLPFSDNSNRVPL